MPHLSLCALGPGRDVPRVQDELAPLLPVRARAEQVHLVRYEAHGTRVLRTYPLGAAAAGETGSLGGAS